MNIFLIPSWYPSVSNPAWGIFCKEQALALAECFPESNFGISLWGQNNEETLLYARDHLKNLKKILGIYTLNAAQTNLRRNLTEFNVPVLSWTRKIANGNIEGIIQANDRSFTRFMKMFGKPDVIHAHVGYPGGYIAMRLSKKYNVPYIITEHMVPFPFETLKSNSGELIFDLDESYRKASKIIAVSEHLKRSIESINLDNVTYIPNLVDETYFKPKSEVRKNNLFNFLFIGELIHRKGVDLLLSAISIISKEGISVTIGGDGVMENVYKRDGEKLDLQINWLGFLSREQVVEEMQRCDVFVSTSRQENLPMVLLEAIACGKPIIATRCGGPEIIVNEENGVLVPVDDKHALADAMIYIKNHYKNYNSAVIRKDFEKRFSRDVVTNQIINVYKHL